LRLSSSNITTVAYLRLVGVLCFLLITILPLKAGSPYKLPWDGEHFSGDPKAIYDAASAAPVSTGADVLVLEEHDQYSFDAEGRQTYTHYSLYKILTQAGAENWDVLASYWEPWHDDRPAFKARVITKDYEVHPLEEKTFTDSPAHSQEDDTYSDRRILRAPLPAIGPGSVVEEERVVREKSPFFSAGSVSRLDMGRSVPVRHMRITLEAPSSFPLQYESRLLPNLKPDAREANGIKSIVFDSGPIEALKDADNLLPSDIPAYPTVTFSTGKSWQVVAEAYSALVDSQTQLADLKATVGKLTAGLSSRDEKASAILDYLNHEVRYTGIEFGENNISPHSPVETLKQKYGDCKDKSTLLIAMLRAAGIPSYMALLDVGPGEDVSASLPGLGMFDHAIVYVPGAPDALWIDTTDEYARLRQMPTADQGRLALIAKSGTTELLRTPESSSRDNTTVEKRQFYLAEYGPARIVETTEPRGSFESVFRSAYADPDNEDRKKQLTEYIKNQYLAEKLDRMDRSDPGDFAKPFQLTLETKKARRGYTDLRDAVAAIRLESIFERLPDSLQTKEADEEKEGTAGAEPKKKRTSDYQLRSAFSTEWQYTIVPPVGFHAKALPKSAQMNAGPARLTEDFSADDKGVVHATIRFDTVKSRFTVAEATELRNQVADWKQAEAIMIHFEPTAEALFREGKTREGFHAYRDLIQLHPKEAVHHLQIADALLEAGLGEAAREESRKAALLEPNSALAQKVLAEVLEYDLVGRKFRLGSDYAGAEAALRTAQKLDSDDKEITGNLAILLEHNHEGRRYGDGAPLKQAVEQYGTLTSEQLSKIGLRNNPAFALFYASEFAEAEKEGKAQNPQLNALIVACEAALRGADAGLAESSQRSSGDDARKKLLKTAGEMLMNVRKYPVAADLLDAGANGDNASATAALAAGLRKARHHEDVVPTPDPAGIATQIFLLLTDGEVPKERMQNLASRNARKTMDLEDPEELKKSLRVGRTFRSAMARTGASPDVALDLTLQLTEVNVEGNDATGYRVKMNIPGSKNLMLFVVKEDGAYKLLDSIEKPNAIGLEILDRIDAGNLAGAKILLDWLREQQHLSGGDDPLEGDPFPRFWRKGKEANAEEMRLAAAALLVQTDPTAKQGIALLEAAQSKSVDDTAALNVKIALLSGYGKTRQFERLLATASELAKKYPDSAKGFQNEIAALCALGRFEEADRLAQDRLKQTSDDLPALRAFVRSAEARQDYPLAYERAKAVLKSGKGDSSDKNQLAWLSLFSGSIHNEDLETALAAAQATQNSANVLHTLGCIYAELGKTKQAREVLVQAMDASNMDEPNEAFWYAFGRIAEQNGEREVATAIYKRVTKPKWPDAIPSSSYWLAQNRTKALAAEGNNGVRADSK
jgi:transglutaminase-like putative cysteine protease/Flp pilus assembly protein TadD